MSTLETGLCGELFKAGETNSNFKLRWFHLHPNGELTWSETVEQAPKGTVPMRGATVKLEAEPVKYDKGELRYGFVITPAGAPRTYRLQASSPEERRLWADALEAAAHPEVSGSQLAGQGRVVRMVKPPPPGLLGVQLVSAAGMPCVTVTAIDSESATAAGLLVGDVVLAMRCLAQTEPGKRATTVLRSAAVANRAFGHASGELELRLAHYNREVKLTKVGGVAGVAVAPSSTAKSGGGGSPGFAGVAVSSLKPDGAGVAAGLHVGDHVLSVNAKLCHGDADRAGQLLRESPAALKLVLRGETRAIDVRKDAEGRLGLAFVQAESRHRGVAGAVIGEVAKRSAADDAKLRTGDLIVAVDGALVGDHRHATERVTRAPRAVNLVVWRPQPADGGASAGASAPGAEPCAAGGSLKATGGDAVGGGDGGDGGAGAQADFYYSHDVLRGVPAGLGPVYEDLTTRSVS